MEIGLPCPTPVSTRTGRGATKEASPDVERHVFCAHYESCLAVAVRGGWEAWTCGKCALRYTAAHGLRTNDFAQQRARGWHD